ncbi:MAG: magnesium transporter MgtE N-terminal domain-containing protein [Omnitrophica WOR_2 bacterium]
MAFISQLTGKPVVDSDGKSLGVLKDLIARTNEEMPHPVIDAIVVEQKGRILVVPYSDVVLITSAIIPLNCREDEIKPYTPGEQDIYLVENVLDKQIIDTNGARVVRVNDLELVRVNGHLFVSNVDIGGMGILRRIGMAKTAESFAARFHLKMRENTISWDFVEPLIRDRYMRLKVPVEKITELHPADIAEIISDMNHAESGELLDTLGVKYIADALEEVEPDFQASLIQDMPDEKVADVLEEMEPDEAADLLAELPKERSEDLLELMEDDDENVVRKLLSYPDDSAGGLMTTEYASIRPGLTAEQAIVALRASAHEAENIFYVYVIDEENHLIGVFYLSDLIIADPKTPVENIMHRRVVSVSLLEKQEKIAQLVAKYDLLAIPVVDDQNRIQGMVTANDALDKIIPTAWKKRLPRFYY